MIETYNEYGMTIEFEYWWLLILPLFFILGWIAARVDIKQIVAESTTLPAAYFKGLNFLISDQHKKAIDAFSEAIHANSDSLELHFAMGSLFRRTGETDRAINMHLNLLEKKELTKNQKEAVKAELAADYLKAGLYDRAEELFKNLTNKRYRQPALYSLLEIYVREREWLMAIDTAIELERLSGVPFRIAIAQYHCELAMNAMIDQQADLARLHLANALDANKKCIRANVLLGDLEVQSNNHVAAIAHWKHIEFQDPEYLGLVATKLLQSFSALGKSDEGIALLKTYLENYKLASIMTALYEATVAAEGADSAATLARNELIRKPSLQTLDQLLQARAMSEHSTKSKSDQDIQLMQQTVRNAIGNRAAYHCNQCGFRAKQYHWQCPACNAWESLPSEPSEAISRQMTITK